MLGSNEETDVTRNSIRMLNAFMVVLDNDRLAFRPHSPNILFAIGLNDHQETSRIGTYWHGIQNYDTLRTFLITQFVAYDHTTCGDDDDMLPHALLLILECLCFGRPVSFVVRSLMSIPKRFTSPFIRLVREK